MAPLTETFDSFWIANKDPNKYKNLIGNWSPKGLLDNNTPYWKPYCYYFRAENYRRGSDPIDWDNCWGARKSFVCEREIVE